MVKNRVLAVTVGVLGGWSTFAFGQELDAQTLRVSTRLDSRAVENANLTPDDDAAVSEMQTEASVLVVGGLRERLVDFNTDYSLTSRHYSRFSDRDDQLLLGASQLIFGPSHRRHFVELSHSSNEILVDPALSDLPDNRDSRTTLAASGFTSVNLGRPNVVSLQASVMDYQFEENFANEAKSVGGGANYLRHVSAVNQFGVSASGYTLDYRYTDDQMDYSQVSTIWRGALRHSRYEFELGHNSMKHAGATESSPLIALSWEYRDAGQGVTAEYSQMLSNTAQGSGADVEVGGATGVDGRLEVVDQFKLSSLDLLWYHNRLCNGCSVALGLQVQEESYVDFTDFSSRELNLTLGLEYRLNSALTFELDALVGDFTATEVQIADDFKHSQVILALSFPRWIRDATAAVYVGATERNFEVAEGYVSSFVGARFQYLLLDR